MKLRSKLFALYVLFVALYSFFLLASPSPRIAAEQYQLSTMQVRLLDLTIIAPLAIIWFAAFYGYAKLRRYANLIKDSKDGAQVNKIATGMMILTIGLPATYVISSFVGFIVRSAASTSNLSTIVRHYADLLVPLAAFLAISLGARGLSRLAKQRISLKALHALALTTIIIGTLYTYAVLTAKNFTTAYYQPAIVVVLTLIIPYLYTWYIGLLAAYEVHLYSQKVAGIVYRRSWDRMAIGIAAIITSSIAYQYIATLSRQFTSMRLLWLLCIVYGLLALMAASYILVALGAKKLQKIEEV